MEARTSHFGNDFVQVSTFMGLPISLFPVFKVNALSNF